MHIKTKVTEQGVIVPKRFLKGIKGSRLFLAGRSGACWNLLGRVHGSEAQH